MIILVVQTRNVRKSIINETRQSWHAELRDKALAVQGLKATA
jgi:hypothetical protein